MPLAPGACLGPYELTGMLGAGGMGEVYRARDARLKRDVALKILPESFATDADRLARFQREAEVLASLNHPHIAHVYGLERSDGVQALVMELVEGETLADRVARGSIPVDEALPIALQIAAALEAAHEQGIVHRDLKPANITITPEGVVKVLDFGLAKVVPPAASGGRADVTASPTITSPAMMTGVGVILGTAAYMAPEQAKGHEADKRSDIWALGCVLYEMLTGTRAFQGEDVSDTLASVLKTEPDWAALPAVTPGLVRTLLRRCLAKDRTRRLDSAASARLELDDALTPPPPLDEFKYAAYSPRVRFWGKALPAAVVAGTIMVGLAAGYGGWTLKPADAHVVTRFAITPTEVLFSNPNFPLVALSPDGSRLAYVAANRHLYLRAFDRLDAALIARGTDTPVRSPFFSPDGQWIGFFHAGQLKKVSVSGGAPVTLCATGSAPFGVSWAADDTILFAEGEAGIWRVSDKGGTPEQIIMLDAGQRARGPQLLPDGRTVLFTLAQTESFDDAQVVIQSLDSRARKTLITGGTDGRYLATGHLVYALRGTVLAVPFDPATLSLRGGPVPLVEGVRQGAIGTAQFALSSEGTLAYVPPFGVTAVPRTLVWVDRQGREEAIAAPPRPYVYPRLAPDGTRLALDIADDNRDIWVWDFPRGTLTRLTSDPTADRQPVWTPDGRRIIFSSDRAGVANLFWQDANGSGTAERLTDSSNPRFAHSMSPDGRRLIVRENPGGAGANLMILEFGDAGSRPVASTLLGESGRLMQTSFSEFNAEVSPDGRWLAYQSNKSGAYEVYVRPFPDVARGQWLVSTAGGTEPLWARDGRELFYRAPNGAVMRVAIARGSTWTAGAPAQLIDARSYAVGAIGNFREFSYRTYDVSLDGERFLMITNSDATEQSGSIVVVQHWHEELNRLVPVN